ncbi:protoheme IX farnesyltransferase, mitochondrial [Rhododendron vialii]|uniref:protoheme IX farnesyltransferase, mitochondrial n=1 Tax=Rhododendron vialii TaxID=182163 RepID=UPI00265EA4D3|nr:protoheme IX farnesyltransferase, mitochondrial [Rhododendron vialii]
MWRNSLSFSSKLLSSSNPNSGSTFLSSAISTANYAFGRSLSHSPSSTGDLKLGFPKLDRIPSSGFASSAATAIDASLRARDVVDLARHYGRCYWELSKARLSMLVVATSGAGYVLGSGSAIDYMGLCCTCAGTMMVAASANSLNQVFEINNDAKMNRTKNRPLPSARITVPHAVSWASSVGAAGTALLACQANMMAAGLAASNLFLYAFVYTPLKQIHPVNTWVGAVVGAIPPLLGWVAASGQVSLNGMVLPAALYFWQIPHFMALAYLCRSDYAAGGFRMFSLADASGERTALVALRNCLYLIPLGYLAYDWGITSGWFCLESTLLALAITGTALSFYLNRTTKNARRMFHASLLYLPVFMSGLLLHRIPDNQQLVEEEEGGIVENLSSSETLAQEIEFNGQKKVKYASVGTQARPPVAFASVAPFPFLPAPIYPTN